MTTPLKKYLSAILAVGRYYDTAPEINPETGLFYKDQLGNDLLSFDPIVLTLSVKQQKDTVNFLSANTPATPKRNYLCYITKAEIRGVQIFKIDFRRLDKGLVFDGGRLSILNTSTINLKPLVKVFGQTFLADIEGEIG